MSEQFNADLDIIQATPIELELLDGNLNIIQQLDDEPNDVGGLTSAELKAKFDQAGNTIKQYINEKLIPALLASDATETARSTAEVGRIQAETARVSAESQRAAAEALRAAAEPLRISAENERIEAEEERIAAETARVSAEALRTAAEPLRLTAELDRVSSEDIRQGNERSRESNEEARKQNEEGRQQREADLYVWEDFNEARSYRPGNKVCYAGSSYVCLAECTGVYPTAAVEAGGIRYWQLIALRGDTGEVGSGDMEKAIYDPTNKAQDVFAYADSKVETLHAAVMLESVASKFPDGMGTDAIVFNETYKVFVAAIDKYVFTSTTGEVWSVTKLGTSSYTRVLVDKTTGNMVVFNKSASTTGYHSTNGGLTWTKFTIGNPDNVAMTSMYGGAYHNGRYVAIDSSGNVAVHLFNGTLSKRYSAASCGLAVEGQSWAGVFLCGGKFWAMHAGRGDSKKIAYSSNGLTWTLVDTPFGNSPGGLKEYVENGNYCLVRITSNWGYETRDGGLTWTSAAFPLECLASFSMGMVLHAGEVYTCGYSWYAHRPRDEKSWTITRTKSYHYGRDDGMHAGCAFGNGRFIRTHRAVNRTYGGYHTSTDFSNWVGSAIIKDVAGADVSEIIRHALMTGQIKVYSYIGIGTYGSDSPTKIEADFPIGALILLDSGCQVVDMLELTENYVAGAGFNNCYCKRSADYRSVMWYSTTSAANQSNTANRAYHLLVIS